MFQTNLSLFVEEGEAGRMKMSKYLEIFVLSFALASCGASDSCSFDSDVLCPQAVERACSGEEVGFESHVRSLSPQDRAQIVAQSELLDSCSVGDWFASIADEAYAAYADAFYAEEQPWIEARAMRAVRDIEGNSKFSAQAARYLRRHFEDGSAGAFLQGHIESLMAHASNDDIFGILAKIGSGDVLARLSALETTSERDKYLMARWPELPEATRKRIVAPYVSVKWSMQTSGSSKLPQYLTLDWAKFALPDDVNVPDFVVSVDVDSVTIRNDEVKRGQWRVATSFQKPALHAQGSRHARVDLSHWLKEAGHYRVYANAQIAVWPKDVDDDCLADRSACNAPPLLQWDETFDRMYRVFMGVDTGAPHRIKVDDVNRKFMNSLVLKLCNEEKCLTIFDKKAIKTSEILEVEQGRDFYVSADYAAARYPMAARLMARTGIGKAWREIATFYGDAPMSYDVPARGNVTLGSLCNTPGLCKLSLQLRPSLRMARRDPRITRYFGASIDLGDVTIDLKNLTPQQRWQ